MLYLLPLSATTPLALSQLLDELKLQLKQNNKPELKNIQYTLQMGRDAHPLRAIILFDDKKNKLLFESSSNAINNTCTKHLDKHEQTLLTLADQWLKGEKVDWPSHFNHKTAKKIPLQAHPYNRKKLQTAMATTPKQAKCLTPLWVKSPATLAQDHKIDTPWHISKNTTNIDAYLNKAQQASNLPSVIIYTPPYETASNTTDPLLSQDMLKASYYDLITLIQLLTGYYNNNRTLKLIVVTKHNYAVKPSEKVHPTQTLARGIVLAANKELRQITCMQCDFEDAIPIEQIKTMVSKLLTLNTTDSIVACRNNNLYTQSYANIDLPKLPADALTSECTYIITGGLGGIGLLLMEHIASHYEDINIISLSRSIKPLPPTLLQNANRNRIHIQLEQLDIAQADSVDKIQHLLADIDRPLKGIFHCAGSKGAGTIKKLHAKNWQHNLDAKMLGTNNLLALTKQYQLDFLMLFSSISSVIGGYGQADYCAANAYLDGFYVWAKQQGLPVFSINWGAWHQVGMANDLTVNTEDTGLRKEEAIPFLFSALLTQQQPFIFCKDLLQEAPKASKQAKKQYTAQADTIETTINNHLKEIVIDFDTSAQFLDEQLDSLAIIDLITFVNKRYQVNMLPQDILLHKSIHELSQFIANEMTNHTPNVSKNYFSLIPLRKSQQAKTQSLFLFHAAGGTLFSYQSLCKHLDYHYQLYGIQQNTLDGLPANFTLEQMAHDYLNAMLTTPFNREPYILIGHSFGGTIAYEIANQLAETHQKDSIVIMIDAPLDIKENIRSMNDEALMDYFLSQFSDTDTSDKHHPLTFLLENENMALFLEIFRKNIELMQHYQPKYINNRIALTYIKAEIRDKFNPDFPEKEWQSISKQRLQLHSVSGNHNSMLMPEHVTEISDIINKLVLEHSLSTA